MLVLCKSLTTVAPPRMFARPRVLVIQVRDLQSLCYDQLYVCFFSVISESVIIAAEDA